MSGITGDDDIITYGDVADRIAELEDGLPRPGYEPGIPAGEEECAELAALIALREAVTGQLGPRWRGRELIRADYFTSDYVREQAGVDAELNRWPFNHVDWEQAARELRLDYASIAFGDAEYLYRM